MWWRTTTLLTRVLLTAAVPLVLFLIVLVVAGLVLKRQLHLLALEKHSREVLADTQRLIKTLDLIRLEAYRSALLRGPDRLAEHQQAFRATATALLDKVADSPDQQSLLRQALAAEAAWAAFLQTRQAPEVAPQDFFRQAGPLRAKVEEPLNAFLQTEEHLLDDRFEAASQSGRESAAVIGAAGSLAVVLAVALSILQARALAAPVRQLRAAAVRLTEGRLETLTPTGPREIADLIKLFNHMGLTLVGRAEALQAAEERLRTYVGGVSHILWTTDAAGEADDMPAWRAFTGQEAAAVRGLGWLDAVHPDDRERVTAAWRHCVAGATPLDVVCRIRRADAVFRYFHCRGVPVTGRDGQVREWIGTCTDVTDREEVVALQQAKEAAEAASRAKSDFLAKMSHELRTPLNAVIGMSKMLLTQRFGPLNAKQADYLQDISKAGEHLLSLINDILDLSKVAAGKLELEAEAFGLAEALQSAVKAMGPVAEAKGLALTLEPPAEDGPLTTDRSRLRQVLFNLLSNAIKYTPEGGVTVAAEWVASPTRHAAPAPAERAAAVRVRVRDTGIGIAAEDQAAVWEEFRQLRAGAAVAKEGTGLGLPLTRRLVELMGGTVWLESAAGRGSTFGFAIPRHLPLPSVADLDLAPVAVNRPLVLVVEDHAPTHKLLVDWLDGAGLATASAFDGPGALRAARERRPRVIILDVQLPGKDGWQVLEDLRADPATAAIPVIVVSIVEDGGRAARHGVCDYLLKPLDRDALLGRIRRLVPVAPRNGRPPRALVVESDPAFRRQVGDLLTAVGCAAVAADGGAALARLAEGPVDLALLGLGPEGIAALDALRGRPGGAALPVIVLADRPPAPAERPRLSGRIQALLRREQLTAERLRSYLTVLGLTDPAPPVPGGRS